MALGGGIFTTQNKVLPGSYINFVSLASAAASLSDRGTAAMAFELDWGADGDVFEVTNGDFQKDSLKIFGYDYTHDKLKGLRDLFRNTKTLYAYKLNSGGLKAKNKFATAKYSGIRGNDLKVVIQYNMDDTDLMDVKLLIETSVIDMQTVKSAASLKDNDFVTWDKAAVLELTASEPLFGGTNGDVVTAADYQAFLNKIESYSFNAVGVVSETPAVNELFAAFCKRLRDEMGIKFQAVVHNCPADYEGVVNVKNCTSDDGWPAASLVYWVTGIIAACEVNRSNLNKKYNGEFTVEAEYTQKQLETAVKSGEFALHKVNSVLRVLSDINSLVTLAEDKGAVFQDNQSIRVIDQIGNDIAVLFNTKYLGVVPNDKSGRISLWSDIVKHHEQLQDIRAIEGFSSGDVMVEQGDTKKSVVVLETITVVNAMAQLYMTCRVA